MLKKFLIIILFLIAMTNLFSQNLSGVINTYDKVIETNSCEKYIRINNPSSYSIGDRLIIIQMQGASISTTDNSSYGNVSSLNDVGNWEVISIESILGDTLFLEFSILRNYNVDSKVQVVSFPLFENVIVENELIALAWDGEIGGVLAFESGSLVMQADINVSGLGFRGGAALEQTSNDCNGLLQENDYIYHSNNWRGARKGESVWINNTNYPSGRGAPANGGGGGNDHNSGGGGGSNVTSAGRGGENLEPTLFGCHGFFPGVGGHGLDYSSEKLFLGGGGGAGHGNNENSTAGGNGGGLVIIKSQTIQPNGFFIKSNGFSSDDTVGDGAGGGGAGGSVFLDVVESNETNFVQLIGGKGGDVDNNNAERCAGPGGGGSGGFLVTNVLGLEGLTGGYRGESTNSVVNDCTPSNVGSEHGQDGFQIVLYPWIQSFLDPSSLIVYIDTDSVNLCPLTLNNITVIENGLIDNYQWQYFDGADWVDIINDSHFLNTQTSVLGIYELPIDFNIESLRCIVSNDCGFENTTNEVNVNVVSSIFVDFEINIEGVEVNLLNLSTIDQIYHWNFGDGTTSNDFNASHIYNSIGTYSINLTVENDCESIEFSQTISLINLPQIEWSTDFICAPASVHFMASPDNGTTYEWVFEGGSPSISSEPNPTIDYINSGLFDVSLTIDGLAQSLEDTVRIYQPPFPIFDFTIEGTEVTFYNTSTNASDFIWDFGDGSALSNEESPIHDYAEGFYTVTLQALNGPCSIILSKDIGFISPVQNDWINQNISIYPNPVTRFFYIDAINDVKLILSLVDIRGRITYENKIFSSQHMIDFSNINEGAYFLILENEYGEKGYRKIIK